ncbi:MAG: ImmA/IrrE family metallo-endopeptidase [Nitrospinae bacterium]|nr:ImmA/IrrE family metallo-endopeptidase [Nitrospinota bacterium]
MTQPIPVNPAILQWARQTAGFSVEEVVLKLDRKSITAETIAAWERGESAPTYPQLETLAYRIYRRPLALFFFPDPPSEETPEQTFRTLPEYEIDLMPPRIHFLIREAKVRQLNLAELYDNINPAERQIARDLSFAPDVSAEKMATVVREYLQIDIAMQTKWKDSEEALKSWRHALEEHGVFVFKAVFKADDFSGICLYDEQFPVIYVNNSKSKSRQIFTLFHELAHLLFRTGGVDTRIEDYLNYLHGDNRRIEILCNRFAGEFLVPSRDFARRTKGMRIDDASIQKLADCYHVSREAILRKMVDRSMVNQKYYEDKVREWERAIASKKSRTGGDYYRNTGAYLGEPYLEMAFSRYYQKRISTEQLADYLGVKVKSVPGMEAMLFRKGVAV